MDAFGSYEPFSDKDRQEGKLQPMKRKGGGHINDTFLMRRITKALYWFSYLFPPSISSLSSSVQCIPGLPFVIKSGPDIRLEEAHLMIYAAKLLKGTDVKVPRVYCAYKEKGIGYILMQRMNGDTMFSMWPELSKAKKSKAIRSLREALKKIHICRNNPMVSGLDGTALYHMHMPFDEEDNFIDSLSIGPFASSQAFHQHLFEYCYKPWDYEDHIARGIAQLHNSKWEKEASWLTHGDLSPYNILVDERGSVSILDWETAGWWPSYFEWDQLQRYMEKWYEMDVSIWDFIPVDEEVVRTSASIRSLIYVF